MEIIKGDMFKSSADYIFVTTNATIKVNGEVVMGRGAARELKRFRKDLPLVFGQLIRNIQNTARVYGVGWELSEYSTKYGIFQVKYDWWEDANINLIKFSTYKLNEYARGILSKYNISMNFPGIGNGRLNIEDVLPIVSILPDNVSLHVKD